MIKKRVLVLGAEGMLGNAVFRYLRANKELDVVGTGRRSNTKFHFLDAETFGYEDFSTLVAQYNPSYIVNCIGYIRPAGETLEELKKSLRINSLFPQNLALGCTQHGVRFIHFSTDCVFSGNRGPYSEHAFSDETSIYGVSKFLGEVKSLPHLTIRTSIIGREFGTNRNLLDWFLSAEDSSIRGYTNVFWNGISTVTAAKIVERVISKDIVFDQSVIQIASETMSKYELLQLFKAIYKKDVSIEPHDQAISNKTLVPSNAQATYFSDLIPSLKEQILELKEFYE